MTEHAAVQPQATERLTVVVHCFIEMKLYFSLNRYISLLKDLTTYH